MVPPTFAACPMKGLPVMVILDPEVKPPLEVVPTGIARSAKDVFLWLHPNDISDSNNGRDRGFLFPYGGLHIHWHLCWLPGRYPLERHQRSAVRWAFGVYLDGTVSS